MKIRFINYILVLLLVTSCTTGYDQLSKNFKVPKNDIQIIPCSDYEKNGDDLRKYRHDFNYEKNSCATHDNIFEKYTKGITIDGKQITEQKNDCNYLNRSKIIGNNDYYIEINNKYKIEKQNGVFSCWASCLQNMILTKYEVKIPQEEIVKMVKGKKDLDHKASVEEISSLMGYSLVTVTDGGAMHLLKSLGNNEPVMVGLKRGEGGEKGHAVIIIGARYSYIVNNFSIISLQTDVPVFREFHILDPKNGTDEMVKADKYANDIDYIFTFDERKI